MGRRKNALILAFLAFQLLLPLRYYLGSDEFDERFAWRMFSPIRMTECRVGAVEGRPGALAPVSITEDVQMSWLNLMRRARVPVIRAYADRRCARLRGEVDEPVFRVDIQCAHPDGNVRRPIAPDENLCEARP